MIVLIGFMGSGKSTVGRLLAGRLGLPFVDVDDVIERRAGASIADIFRARGEPLFRSLERDVTAEVMSGPEAVVALGGGAVDDPATCAALEWETVVLLDVGYAEAMKRIGADPGRPMLVAADPRALFHRRKEVYRRLADITVNTDGRAPDDLVEELARHVGWEGPQAVRRVAVPVRDRGYEVVVGNGLSSSLDDHVPELPDAEIAFFVSHPSLRSAGAGAARALARRQLRTLWSEVPEGEGSKSLAVAERLYDELSDAGAHRHDVVVSFGGGVVCDLAGFVASTYHRGTEVVHVPTTLLAQVDAAIGGKTAVNLSHGKNLVGTVHQPASVVCDVGLLKTLPPEEITSGMAEVVKYGLIADPTLLELVERRASDVDAAEPDLMIEVVARSAAIKAEIVAEDERERGRRAHLNYGHTFGHALERLFGFRGLRHGEAVALGMMAAAYLAEELGRIGSEDVELHRRALSSAGLPTALACDLEELERAWSHDKKYRRGVRFVLLRGIAKPEAGIEAPRAALARAIERLAA